jgi:hypothetical protein
MEASTYRVGRKMGRWIGLGLLLAACAPDEATDPDRIGMLASHAAGTTVRLNVINGWHSLNNKTLLEMGTLPKIAATDGQYVDLEPGGFLSLDLSNIPTDHTVSSVKVHAVMFIEPLEIPPYTNKGGALLQVGGGTLTNPFIAMEAGLVGSSEQIAVTVGPNDVFSVTWNVTKWVRSAARVNNLRLIIRAVDPFGEGTVGVDRAFVEVTYGPAPAAVAMDWKVSLFPTDGWDAQNGNTLSALGKISLIAVADSETYDISAGQSLAVQFNAIPSNATVSSVKVHIARLPKPAPIDPTEPPDSEFVAPASAFLQAGGGALSDPTPALEKHVDIDEFIEWDVTPVARLASEVNGLKVVITNPALAGAALEVTQVLLKVQFGPTPPPIVIEHPVTIFPTNGWDEQIGKTLVDADKLNSILTSDGASVGVEAGRFLAIEFGNIPADSTVKSVKLHVSAYQDIGGTPGGMLWQVGGGASASPFVAMEHRPDGSDPSVTWIITPWVRTASRVNGLVLVIRNLDPLGKKVMVDGARLEVVYGPTPAKSTTGFPVTLFVTDGYDSQTGTTLTSTGSVSTVNVSDGQRDEIGAPYFASYKFQRIPGGALVQGAKIHVRHYEEMGFASGGMVWRAGGGALSSPTSLIARVPAVLSGDLAEATVPWDVSSAINTATLVNDLKLKVLNREPLGKKININRVYATVTHK